MTLPATLPVPRTPDPAEAPAVNWGILAPGWIARLFVSAAKAFTRQRFVAVGSRSAERAQAFADEFSIPKVYDSYEALVSDPEVQAIYVASPHSEHYAQARLALDAGKNVLVEKAFTRSADQAQELADLASAKGLALMEAMWTRFLPRTDVVRQLIEDGALGELETVHADHGQPLLHVPRLVRPELAGGALLDLGIYPVSWAVFALGLPSRVQAVGSLTELGVDRQEATILDGFEAHPHARAVLHTTMAAATPTAAMVAGSKARVELDGPFYAPGPVRLVDPEGTVLTRPENKQIVHQGLSHECAAFAQLVADGRTESPLLPVSETVGIMRILDEVRRQLGVVYPGE